MKKTLLVCTFMSVSVLCLAQPGVIAHWDMNGTANDVSGNGHNGTAHNVSLTTGSTGMSNTAYLFNGTDSWITVPYSPGLNSAALSICATVKVNGFYNGLCQSSMIIERGVIGPGRFQLVFNDNVVSSPSICTDVDTTQDVFQMTCGPNVVGTYEQLQYTPAIQEGIWYKVVATFGNDTFKIYVNGVLKNTYAGSGAMVDTSTDSISIGYNMYEASAGYPYAFNGVIDDIELYNRVLTDTEVTHYNAVAVRDVALEDMIILYPIPATNMLNVELPTGLDKVNVQVINMNGQSVLDGNISHSFPSIDIATLPAGVYTAKFIGNDDVVFKRFVKL